MATLALLSVEEYLALPSREDDLHDELIEGEIVLSPSAKPLHGIIVRRISKLIQGLEKLGYELITDIGFRLGQSSVPEPDLAVVRADRLKTSNIQEYLAGSPELAIEVFSPSNRKGLMAQKAALYLQYGAEAVWVVYPKKRTAVVHDADGETEVRCGENLNFHGVVVPVSSIFEGL